MIMPPAPPPPDTPYRVRPSRPTVALSVLAGVGGLIAILIFVFVIAAFAQLYSRQDARDTRVLANYRRVAADAEPTLRKAAQDGTLTDAEIVAVFENPWKITRSTREIQVVMGFDQIPPPTPCALYTVTLPLGAQVQVTRKELPDCDQPDELFRQRTTPTPSP